MKALLTLAVLGALATGLYVLAPWDSASTPSSAIVLNRGIGPEPETVDPQRASSTQAQHVIRDVFEGLLSYSPDGEVVGGVAERWKLSDDALEHTFWLRPDARWSNGDPVTAEDFVFSLRRLVDPATAAFYAENLSPVLNARAIVAGKMPPASLGVEATGPLELRIRLEQPTAHFLLLLTQPPAFPVNAKSIAQHGERFVRPGNLVSNGAYTLESWTLGSIIEIKRNEAYWNNANTAIDEVRYHVTPEPSNELNRYLAGELDITSTVPSEAFQRLKTTRPNQLRVAPTLGVYYYGFNMTNPKLGNNPKLREALSLALDRESLAANVVARGETPAYSFVAPGTNNYSPPRFYYATMSQQERNARARRLYEEAGYSKENPLDVEVRYNTSDTHQRIALAIQEMWREVLGFEAELISEEFRVLLSNVEAKEVTQIFRLNWTADYDDAYSFLGILETNNPSNSFGWSNAEFDDLLKRAAAQPDMAARRLLMEEAEHIVLREHPMIPLYFYVGEHMVSPKVKGWRDNMLDYHYSQHLSIER